MHTGNTARSASLMEVSVISCLGMQPLDIYRGPDGTLYVPAVVGSAYKLRVRNLTTRRILVLTSVDGRDTQEQKAADLGNTGFVLGPQQSYDFDGFREDDGHTRQFVFGSPQRSVAVRTGAGTSNVGVLGFAAYREQAYEPYIGVAMASPGDNYNYGGDLSGVSYRGGSGMTKSATFDSNVSAPVRGVGSVGTEIGERQESKVGRTTFDRIGAAEVIAIQYDTLNVLDSLGVTGPPAPDPFPGDQHSTGYAKL